jgi:hypothetical protein
VELPERLSMTTYALQGPSHAGSAIALAAPGGTAGDLAPTGQGVGLLVVCGTAAAGTVTVTLPFATTYDGQTVTSRTVPCLQSSTNIIPLPDGVYGAGTTAVNYSTVAGVTVAAIRIP